MRRLFLAALLLLAPSLAEAISPALLSSKHKSTERLIRGTKPTLWLSANDYRKVTETSGQVSAWASSFGAISFSQGTAANRPILSRGDNRENRFLDSESLTTANWPVNSGSFSSDTFTATAASAQHMLYNLAAARPVSFSGAKWRVRAEVEYVNYANAIFTEFSSTNYDGVSFNAQTCAYQNKSASVTTYSFTTSGSRCIVTYEFTQSDAATSVAIALGLNSAASQTSIQTWTPAGTEQIKIYNFSVQRVSADPTYIATTSLPVYAGIAGRKGIVFDGSNDGMSSASALSDIVGASAKTVFIVARQDNTAITSKILSDTSFKFYADVPGTADIRAANDDGSADVLERDIVASKVYIAAIWHDGTNLYSRTNTQSTSSVASGATNALTGTLWLGNRATLAQPVNGPIVETIAYDKVLPASVISTIFQGLRRKYGAN